VTVVYKIALEIWGTSPLKKIGGTKIQCITIFAQLRTTLQLVSSANARRIKILTIKITNQNCCFCCPSHWHSILYIRLFEADAVEFWKLSASARSEYNLDTTQRPRLNFYMASPRTYDATYLIYRPNISSDCPDSSQSGLVLSAWVQRASWSFRSAARLNPYVMALEVKNTWFSYHEKSVRSWTKQSYDFSWIWNGHKIQQSDRWSANRKLLGVT